MSYSHLTIKELIWIEKYYLSGTKPTAIASKLKRSNQPIYNVINHFKAGGTAISYYDQYEANKKRCGRKRKELTQEETDHVLDKVKEGWNPQVIVGRAQKKLSVCERTLYRMFERGTLNVKLLPWQGKRKPNGYVEKRGKQAFRRSIHERAADHPNFENEFGHLEGDTIVGKNHKSAVITLAERASKAIITIKPKGRTAENIEEAILNWYREIPRYIFKSITFDCGKEFSNWKSISHECDIDIYFADPGRPCQRGLNENSNGLLRRDGLTKGMDFNTVSQSFIETIASKRNNIPRKSLNFQTPLEVFMKHIDGAMFLA